MRHIYEFGDSPCCMKVRMALLEKGLAFEKRFVNSWAFDHYQPEYQEINPLSLVPTLVDEGGTTVIQSKATTSIKARFSAMLYALSARPALVRLSNNSPLV